MAKRPGSLTLTFSKKNIDIRRLLEGRKSESEAFIVTDYICEAIRFYEKYKDTLQFNNLEAVKELIDERLKQYMKINSAITLGLANEKETIDEVQNENGYKENQSNLEKNLDDISIEED